MKSGFTEEQSALLARTAVLYQNIADEELDAGQAANFLISQMKAFNIDASDSIGIIDSLNEVWVLQTSLNRVNCGENLKSYLLTYDSDMHRGLE